MNLKYPNILHAFGSRVWALQPEKIEEIRAFLHFKARGGTVAPEEVARIVGAQPKLKAQVGELEGGVKVVGRTAVMPVFGVLAQRVGLMGEMSGGVSTEALGNRLGKLVSDPAVQSVVMVYDSPGGDVFGVPELAAKIRSYRAQKRIVGMVDSTAASGALWLIAQSSEVVITPGGMMGSHGVYIAHEDWSRHDEQIGVTTSVISSAPYKTELQDTTPLSPEAAADLKGKVDHYHAMFTRDLAAGRRLEASVVERDFGQGRMVTASEAVRRGMADRIATLDQVLTQLGANSARRAQALARTLEVG